MAPEAATDYKVPHHPTLVSPTEAAELLGISRASANRWIIEGVIPAHVVGRGYVVERADIDRILEAEA